MPVRRSDDRRRYLLAHPAMFTIALCAAIGGIVYVAVPGILAESSLGVVLPWWLGRGWALFYTLGGSLVVFGILKMDARYEVTGLIAMSACYLIYGYVVFVNRGLGAGAVAASVFLGLALGTAARAYVLRYEPEVAPWRRRRSL